MKSESVLVSVIIAAYNAERFINNAIQSAIDQTHKNWELLIVDDGSTDNTYSVIKQFTDKRIFNFSLKENKGVSAARNLALKNIKGDFFCFLDADDRLPTNSLRCRLEKLLAFPDVDFVDGKVSSYSEVGRSNLSIYTPRFKGEPLGELMKLSNSCFYGPTWMIRKNKKVDYLFKEGMSHAEDLLFCISIANGRKYDFVDEEVYIHLRRKDSAMSNLQGLEAGYMMLYSELRNQDLLNPEVSRYLKLKLIRIMTFSYLKKGQPFNALMAFIKFIKL